MDWFVLNDSDELQVNHDGYVTCQNNYEYVYRTLLCMYSSLSKHTQPLLVTRHGYPMVIFHQGLFFPPPIKRNLIESMSYCSVHDVFKHCLYVLVTLNCVILFDPVVTHSRTHIQTHTHTHIAHPPSQHPPTHAHNAHTHTYVHTHTHTHMHTGGT